MLYIADLSALMSSLTADLLLVMCFYYGRPPAGGRRPLYFTADVSILLLFSPANLGGLWADRHQTLPHVRW